MFLSTADCPIIADDGVFTFPLLQLLPSTHALALLVVFIYSRLERLFSLLVSQVTPNVSFFFPPTTPSTYMLYQ